ncbi:MULTISPECIES: MarR family winged helix-turn-helix transcriptional regulator [Bacillota]|jgi:DNA-binding MarR family transcriptional regulator|uniref:MarR family transcriptional regulator n=1 Tax=Amedibacillus hominis TaxID=2897776 RepID=A0ABS9RAE4_9FIRM|nr:MULTISPECIES: MarR family transcriptional regulator [Bacillota]MCH4286123.1 MarR family transcriptional regulator [Amedibacillus hominis]RGB53370.1 MarR family transcriptional regulator [Absiella sp. AM22-9]RGB59183.1 MarR family transcriptional regulator [Absiella sp. AM10-20]RGB67437.1 MarR family transcriptional regulator [Absiella sp. AM09-45]RGB76878.1 MarR family transcriptional regulator [Absiella sp. AM09-50]
MDDTRHTLNELLVDLFNYILLIEEKNLRDQGVKLSMTEVHILEAIQKSESNMMSAIAKRLMVTQGTLTVSTSKLVKKGYVERVKDEKDKRIVRLTLTDKAESIMQIHNQFHEAMIEKLLNELELDKEEELINSLKNLMKFFKEKY